MDTFKPVMCPKSVLYEASRIAYWSNVSSPAATLVFIHGWSCSSTLWKYQVPLLHKFHSILIDLPGHGQSAAPHIEYTLEHFARAVAAVLETEQISRAVLVGFSMGGPVSTMVLRLFPEIVAGIIYVDSFFNLPEHYLRGHQRSALALELELDDKFQNKIEQFWSHKTTMETRQEVLNTMMATAKHVRVNATTTNCMPHDWRTDEIFDLPAQLLVTPMYSELDPRWLHHLPNLKKEIWNDNGHFLFMEEPDRFNAAIEGFLETHRLLPSFVSSPGQLPVASPET